MAVLVGNPTRDSRAEELPCNPRFADMVAGELLPWLSARYPITSDPARTVVAGSSYGGLASAWLGLRHPQRFARVLSLSGSFWWAPARPPGFVIGGLDDVAEGEWLTRQFATAPRSEVVFYLAPGLLERSAPSDGPGILETNRHLRDVLQARGQRVIYREFGGGHDYVNWRSELAEGLIALLGHP
jgi:enterochelin esterase family protein